VEETAENLRVAAEDVKRLKTSIIPARDPNKRLFTSKVAIGTRGIITPWNSRAAIPSEYFGPGLAARNTIVVKPAEQTPLSGFLLTQCIAEAQHCFVSYSLHRFEMRTRRQDRRQQLLTWAKVR